jgi:glutamate formiminotransferase / 5-formyltetrahydrofolate cyclo-ligase
VTDPLILLAVPNISEGQDHAVLESVERAFAPAHFLDIHVDSDHGRAVFTLAGEQGELSGALLAGASEVVERVDLNLQNGLHPSVGALDVMPVVYLDAARRGAACAEVLAAGALIGDELELPVILYGELATRPEHAERAWLRHGGWRRLAERIEAGEVKPDFGPPRAHPTAGVVLAAARPPLIAFNLDLVTGDVEVAKRIAAELRESNGGLPGVRAIGLYLADRGRAQVSTNVHDYRITPLRTVVEEVRNRADVAEAELVGLAPEAAFERFPEDLPLRGFSPERHLLEGALRALR